MIMGGTCGPKERKKKRKSNVMSKHSLPFLSVVRLITPFCMSTMIFSFFLFLPFLDMYSHSGGRAHHTPCRSSRSFIFVWTRFALPSSIVRTRGGHLNHFYLLLLLYSYFWGRPVRGNEDGKYTHARRHALRHIHKHKHKMARGGGLFRIVVCPVTFWVLPEAKRLACGP